MKKLSLLSTFIIATAIGSNVYAQQIAPPGAGDKDLGDKNIKTRSIELERVDRAAKKGKTNPANATTTPAEDRLAVKYSEIKTDYEQIQKSQDVVIKTYQGTGKIDYAQIGKSALEINTSAIRLNSNLFPESESKDLETKKEMNETVKSQKEAEEKEPKKTKSVRDLIVDLDNTIGSFATSPMFQNLRTVDAAVSEKAKLDLEEIISLSAALNSEARKMTTAK
jgi:hypothetical protein